LPCYLRKRSPRTKEQSKTKNPCEIFHFILDSKNLPLILAWPRPQAFKLLEGRLSRNLRFLDCCSQFRNNLPKHRQLTISQPGARYNRGNRFILGLSSSERSHITGLLRLYNLATQPVIPSSKGNLLQALHYQPMGESCRASKYLIRKLLTFIIENDANVCSIVLNES
jgi:hypothetical protein